MKYWKSPAGEVFGYDEADEAQVALMAEQTASVGWTDVSDAWPPPPLPPGAPNVISMRQARLALLEANLLPQVDAAIASMPEPQRSAARIEWEYATELRRDNPTLTMLGAALGIGDQQLDALYIAAAAK